MSMRLRWPKSRFASLPLLLLIGIAALLFLASLLVYVPGESGQSPELGARTALGVVRLDSDSTDRLLSAEARLKDPTPLFLPTPLNAAFRSNPERNIRKPGEQFGDYAAKLVYAGVSTPLELPPALAIPASPALLLDHLDSNRPFVGFAMAPEQATQALPKQVLAELSDLASGRVLLRNTLNLGEWPDAGPWAPCQFLVYTNAAGIVGRPSLVRGSGLAQIDAFLERSLQEQWLVLSRAARLSPGAYRIIVGQ